MTKTARKPATGKNAAKVKDEDFFADDEVPSYHPPKSPRGKAGAKPGAGKDVSADLIGKNVELMMMRAIPFKWVRLRIAGTTPLLLNKAREESLLKMEEKQTGQAQRKKEPRKPKQEFIESCHICRGRFDLDWLTKNLYGFPAVGIKKAMATAGFRYGDAANKKDSMGAFFLHGPWDGLVPIVNPDSKPGKEKRAKLDLVPHDAISPTMRRDFVVIPAGRIGSIAYRPQFFPWAMDIDIRYCPNFISLENVVNYLYLAGQCVGIGSWRIENGGDKGQFKLSGTVEQLPDDYQPPIHVTKEATGGK